MPKLRQLTIAAGVAPAQARLRDVSATVEAVPSRGSIEHQVGFESVLEREPALGGRKARAGQAEHRRVPARSADRVEEELVVVLTVDPRRVGEQREEVFAAVGRRVERARIVGRPRLVVGGSAQWALVTRRVLAQCGGGHVAEDLATETVDDAQPPRFAVERLGDPADHRRPHLPAPADLLDLRQRVRGHDGQHPLLALGGHHLEGGHVRFAARHRGHVDVHADAAACCGFARRTDQARAAEVLDADDELLVEQLEAGLDEPLLLEGIAHLHARTFGRLGLRVDVAETRQRRAR